MLGMADVPARFTISRASDHDAKQESAVSATPAGPRGRTAADTDERADRVVWREARWRRMLAKALAETDDGGHLSTVCLTLAPA